MLTYRIHEHTIFFYSKAREDANMTKAIYPGSFDPVTYGHINLIERAAQLFSPLIVAVAHNVRKNPWFSADERVHMIQKSIRHLGDHIMVTSFSGLLVDFAAQEGAQFVLRGLRAVQDFEFEFQLAHLNRRLGKGLETVFMMTGEEHFYVSSHMIREIAAFGGSVQGLVPAHVEQQLKQKRKENNATGK
jgi:pantetheine-phosphate adenylyltransferase